MNKYLSFLLLISFSTATYAQALTKEEKKEIINQLKEYKKNPEAYKKMIARYKETIDTANATIDRQKSSINNLSKRYAEMQKQMMDAENQLTECQNKPAPKCPECPATGVVPREGTVYKVQIGLFKNLDFSQDFADPKYIGVEKIDGKNRYTISYFTEKEAAVRFVADLKKLGIKGAFVVKYENGERAVGVKKTKKVKDFSSITQ